jgi:hypothetical protein
VSLEEQVAKTSNVMSLEERLAVVESDILGEPAPASVLVETRSGTLDDHPHARDPAPSRVV